MSYGVKSMGSEMKTVLFLCSSDIRCSHRSALHIADTPIETPYQLVWWSLWVVLSLRWTVAVNEPICCLLCEIGMFLMCMKLPSHMFLVCVPGHLCLHMSVCLMFIYPSCDLLHSNKVHQGFKMDAEHVQLSANPLPIFWLFA